MSIRPSGSQPLRSGEYIQTRGWLEKNGQNCCLGVLCRVALKEDPNSILEENIKSLYMLPESMMFLTGLKDKEMEHLVTTVASSAAYGGRRTVGIFDSFANALEFVKRNPGGLWEYSYMFLCIKSVVPNAYYGGMMSDDRKAYWYVFKQETYGLSDGEYLPIAQPPALDYMGSFAVG